MGKMGDAGKNPKPKKPAGTFTCGPLGLTCQGGCCLFLGVRFRFGLTCHRSDRGFGWCFSHGPDEVEAAHLAFIVANDIHDDRILALERAAEQARARDEALRDGGAAPGVEPVRANPCGPRHTGTSGQLQLRPR